MESPWRVLYEASGFRVLPCISPSHPRQRQKKHNEPHMTIVHCIAFSSPVALPYVRTPRDFSSPKIPPAIEPHKKTTQAPFALIHSLQSTSLPVRSTSSHTPLTTSALSW